MFNFLSNLSTKREKIRTNKTVCTDEDMRPLSACTVSDFLILFTVKRKSEYVSHRNTKNYLRF